MGFENGKPMLKGTGQAETLNINSKNNMKSLFET